MVYNYTLKVDNMLTDNEKKILRFIMSNFNVDYSINNIAKECSLTPNGAFKILKKFEKEGILEVRKIANIKAYSINFDNEKTKNILELSFMDLLEGRLKHRFEDLKELKNVTKACIMFGSYIKSKKEPNDIDLFFLLDKINYKKFSKYLDEVMDIVPAKIHDVIQTEEDMISNIKKNDKIVIEAIRNGKVLWGYDKLVRIIKDRKSVV